MLSPLKTRTSIQAMFPSIADPWALPLASTFRWPTLPRPVPLDPGHELTGVPLPESLAPAGVPGVPRLSAPFSVQSAIAILLADELKLTHPADDWLHQEIETAIAVLAMSPA